MTVLAKASSNLPKTEVSHELTVSWKSVVSHDMDVDESTMLEAAKKQSLLRS
jgi:hypothetical protein